jgi:hypothetical protein
MDLAGGTQPWPDRDARERRGVGSRGIKRAAALSPGTSTTTAVHVTIELLPKRHVCKYTVHQQRHQADRWQNAQSMTSAAP